MKNARCPCCGRSTVQWLTRLMFSLYPWRHTAFYRFVKRRRYSSEVYDPGEKCPQCYQWYAMVPRYPRLHLTILLLDMIALDAGGLAALVLTLLLRAPLIFAVALPVFLLGKIAKRVYLYTCQAAVPYDHEKQEAVYPVRYMQVSLEPAGRWRPRDMSGLLMRFDKRSRSPRFLEEFPHGLIPVFLYKSPRRDKYSRWLDVDVAFLRPQDIPADLICQGAGLELLEEDTVAKGTVKALLGAAAGVVPEESVKR